MCCCKRLRRVLALRRGSMILMFERHVFALETQDLYIFNINPLYNQDIIRMFAAETKHSL